MNNKIPKINARGIIKTFFDKDSEKMDPAPRKDWAMIIFSFLALSIFSMFFYYSMFLPQDESLVITNTANNAEMSVKNISKSKLEKTLAPWKERESRFNEYLNKRPIFDFLK